MAKEQWMLMNRKGDYSEIARRFQIDPVTAKLLVNRDLVRNEDIEKYLRGSLKDLYDPCLLKGAQEAAGAIKEGIHNKLRMRIIGDYDIDGVFSTYILYDVIRLMGGMIDYDIPDRVKDGYGLNMSLIEKAKKDQIEMIITCDNGISAHTQIVYAKSVGIQVILTDHHKPLYHMEGDERVDDLPCADVIVDPHVKGETYPFPSICGAVVAWKVMQILLRMFGREEEYLRYLPYAAFATIGDVMPLIDENRIIVKYGLKALEHTGNRGMETLIRQTGIMQNGGPIKPSHVGFILGPCINAAGRLDTAMKSLNMLTAHSDMLADELAEELSEFNLDRQEMTDKGEEAAFEIIRTQPYVSDKVLVIYLPECSERIMGIVAGRVREWTGKPAFVLTRANTPGMLKGSGRSIPAYPMHDALVEVKDLLEVFGGHALAAGLTIREDNLDVLREALNNNCKLTESDLISKVTIDAAMPVSYVMKHPQVIEEMDLLEPCGQGNAGARFAQRDLHVMSIRIMGKRHNVMKFQFMTPEGLRVPGILFGKSDLILEDLESLFGTRCVEDTLSGSYAGMILDVIYVPEYNEFRGEKTLQLSVRNFRRSKNAPTH